MPENNVSERSVPEKRPFRFRQFGIRTLLILVALVAVLCLLVSNEMVREERREKLIAELEANGAKWRTSFLTDLYPAGPPRFWREHIGAWLRGKPKVEPRTVATFARGTSYQQLREFLDLFPTVRQVEIDGADATKEVLQLLASRGPFYEVRITNPLVIDKEKARQIAQIKCDDGLVLIKQECSDRVLANLAEAGAGISYCADDGGDDDWRNVSDDGLKAIAKLPKFLFAHANCSCTDEGVRALAKHPALTGLTLVGANHTDASADVIPTLPALQSINFKRTSHTDAGLAKAITGCRTAEISFENVAVGDQTIAAFAKAPRLFGLSFKDVDLTLEQWDAVAKLPLEHLTIDSKSFSDDKIARLSPLASSLNGLELKTPQITDAGLAWLKQATGLTTLRLTDTQATAATWSSLSSTATLERVGLGGTNVNAETFACMSRMASLNWIILTGNEIDDAELALLGPGITFVNLVDTRVTSDGLKKLAQRKGMRKIAVRHDADTPSLITEADVKEAQAVAGRSVIIQYYKGPADRCD